MRVGNTRLVVPIAMMATILVAGCSSFAYRNKKLEATNPPPTTRATFAIDGKRGNPKVLMFLALSGGGSRAAYLSGAAMLKLQHVFPDLDLLSEVDVISSVSGGSMAGAYYAVTQDESKTAPGLPTGTGVVEVAKDTSETSSNGIEPSPSKHPAHRLRKWSELEVKDRMRRDYVVRWIGNWLWPANVAKYWFTSYDRSDIMAQTLADNLFDEPLSGIDYTLSDMNSERPYLILNATNATGRDEQDIKRAPFGTVFTFTTDDFREYLSSDLSQYPLGWAVMASSAFPFVFPEVTLRDFDHNKSICQDSGRSSREKLVQTDDQMHIERLACPDRRYLHVFDGGNSDNLGLKSVKRALLQLALDEKLKDYDYVIVFLVDAFTVPQGASPWKADPRGFLGRLFDPNVTDAVDSLLQANRLTELAEFQRGELNWVRECPDGAGGDFPSALCRRLSTMNQNTVSQTLLEKMVFYHFGFDDVRDLPNRDQIDRVLGHDLFERLNRIPTSFRISAEHAGLLDKAVEYVLTPDNPCLTLMRKIMLKQPMDFVKERKNCIASDQVEKKTQ